jgi:hypothetical protein
LQLTLTGFAPYFSSTVSNQKGHETIMGFWPDCESKVEFYVSKDKIEHLERCGPEHVFYGILSAAEVLNAPLAVFEGLQREGQGQSLCYSGRPQQHRQGAVMPGRPGYVFLVFVTAKRLVYEWRWEKASVGNPDLPADYDSGRFSKLRWAYGNANRSDSTP